MCPMRSFIESLPPDRRNVMLSAITEVLEPNGLELVKSAWLKALGSGLHEFRIRRPAVVLRVFCHFHGDRIVLLLSGYDKGGDDSSRRQDREIAKARKHLAAWQRHHR